MWKSGHISWIPKKRKCMVHGARWNHCGSVSKPQKKNYRGMPENDAFLTALCSSKFSFPWRMVKHSAGEPFCVIKQQIGYAILWCSSKSAWHMLLTWHGTWWAKYSLHPRQKSLFWKKLFFCRNQFQRCRNHTSFSWRKSAILSQPWWKHSGCPAYFHGRNCILWRKQTGKQNFCRLF